MAIQMVMECIDDGGGELTRHVGNSEPSTVLNIPVKRSMIWRMGCRNTQQGT